MGDLISRSALIAKIKPPTEDDYDHVVSLGNVRKLLLNFANSVPSVDAVEVVRCHECIHRGEWECPMCHEEYYYDEDDGGDYITHDRTTHQGYCHMGERKGDDD